MHIIKGRTISDAVLKCYDTILKDGYYQDSRNGGARAIYDVTVEIANPRSRHLCLTERKSNIFQMIAETFWVMAGHDKLDPYLSFFLPRAKNYSDDGRTWSGAYGPRLYAYDQLNSMVDLFKRDGIYTRRAYIPIFDPELDSTESIERIHGDGELGKDRPCNLGIHFQIINGDQFVTKVLQRSGDIVFGTGSINPFEFSFLHELMYNEVKKIHPEIKLGPYRWHVSNMHLYDFSKDQVEAAVKVDTNRLTCVIENDTRLIAPAIQNWKIFFRHLVYVFSQQIEGYLTYEQTNTRVLDLFDCYNINRDDNLLLVYALLTSSYIAAKNGRDIRLVDISMCGQEFINAIANSGFRKFNVKV